MVNEERVKQLYKLAVYEKNEEKEHRQAGQYFYVDYVLKEVGKSWLTGSFAYLIIAVLWVLGNWPSFSYQLKHTEPIQMLGIIAVYYIVFMILYLFSTVVIYRFRYKRSKTKLDAYVKDLEAAHTMFEREEKLKV